MTLQPGELTDAFERAAKIADSQFLRFCEEERHGWRAYLRRWGLRRGSPADRAQARVYSETWRIFDAMTGYPS